MLGIFKVRRGSCERETSLKSAALSGAARAHARALAAAQADATLAANFFVEFLIDGPDHIACLEICRDLSRNWRDRDKAAAFVAVQQEITEDIQRQFDEDWEAEHGWKYGPSGDKFWEEEEQEMLGLA